MSIETIIPVLLGGLVLFIYSIGELSKVMRSIFTESAKSSIEKYTKNLFSGILIGTISTILLDSSSAVIILVIIFINAGTLDFRKAMGIIMGANIGTTFSSQIIAMDIAKYSILPLVVGLMLIIVSSKEKIQRFGKALLFFGMLFFGLFLMEESVWPLRDSQIFIDWITTIENNHIKGALIGGLVTLIIQSSSATVGLAIVLGKQNLITLAGGIAIMLGAELGTCSDVLIATIRGTRQAIKAGLFHFLFSLITICIGLLLFHPFVGMIELISGDLAIDKKIAHAHVLFNIGGVLIFIPLVKYFELFLNRLIPEKI